MRRCMVTLKRCESIYISNSHLHSSTLTFGCYCLFDIQYVTMLKITLIPLQGKKLWTAYLPAAVTTMALMDLPARAFQAVLVALANCEVHIYRDKNLICTIKTPVSIKEQSHTGS